MKHNITIKFFLITVLVTLLVSACGATPATATVTPTPTATLLALPAIERYATETPTPLPTVTPTPVPDLVSDSALVEKYEGKPVRILGYTLVDYTHMDVYLRSVKDGKNLTLHLDEDGIALKLADIGEDGFTHARESWNRLPEDGVLLSIALDSLIQQGTVFTYEFYWFSQRDEYVYVYLYEQYQMTARDESLYTYANAHTGPDGCSSYSDYYVPLGMVDCLVNSYHEWGTKEGLVEFVAITDVPLDAVGWYEREGYMPYIDDVEEADVPAFIAKHNMPIEVTLFADWNYVGNVELFLYKEGSVPDMFLDEVTGFPKEITINESTLSIADAVVEGESGTLITYSDGYDDELFVPDGYVVVFLRDLVDESCECWSPFLDFTVIGVYR